MLDHYSHVRRTAKKQVTDQLTGGLMTLGSMTEQQRERAKAPKVN
jgi:hypothetical protein